MESYDFFLVGLLAGMACMAASMAFARWWVDPRRHLPKLKVLDKARPGWRETVQSPAFARWIEVQPQEVRALSASYKPADALKLLRLYDESRSA
jgi:hypothetical protein